MAVSILRAGPLYSEYQGGSLRYIRLGGREVLRRVMVAVRDSDWKTVPAAISNEIITMGRDKFRVEFGARHQSDTVDFQWRGSIIGEPEGTIRWDMSGEPLRAFWRNRIGFCVLHPIDECAGRGCIVEHWNGNRSDSRFPELIAPHQPFLDVRSISHEVLPGVRALVRMDGDVFETEDQRNWTDASFKTYCTPLSVPFPVRVGPGDRIRQSVQLSIDPVPTGLDPYIPADSSTISVFRERNAAMPRISICDATQAVSFVNLNRNRRIGYWGIDPRVHADDELTMVENLAGQTPTVHTARTFLGDAPIDISPVLVPRIRAANGWVAVSIGELAQAGVTSIAYNTAVPVLADIVALKPESAVACCSDAPLRSGALVLRSAGRVTAWVANFREIRQAIRIENHEVVLDPFELRRVQLEPAT